MFHRIAHVVYGQIENVRFNCEGIVNTIYIAADCSISLTAIFLRMSDGRFSTCTGLFQDGKQLSQLLIPRQDNI